MAQQEQAVVVRNHNDYFHLMNQYLLVQAWALNNVLKGCGISSASQRKEICAQFGLSMGELFDSEWLRVNGKRYFPLLIFSERFLTHRRTIDQLGALLGPNKLDEFHPLAVDAATVLFGDQNESIDEQSVGRVEPGDQA
jgi:hypothetical protein